jgi:ketosteroid isomerase-like protein
MLWPMAMTPKQKSMKMTKLFGSVLLAGIILSSQAGYAQTSPDQTAALLNATNGKLIRAYYAAWENKDWNSMEQVLADGFTFSSPLDDHISVSAFKERCWPNASNIKRFEVDKFVINGDEAFVITNGYTNAGKLFRNGEYFKIKGGKISAYECFFGPGVSYPNSGK